MKLNKKIKLTVLALAGAALATSAQAQGVLLTVDVSNPGAVVFTAATNTALVNHSSSSANGVSLLSFLTDDSSQNMSGLSGTLIGGGSGVPYDSSFSGGMDMAFYSANGSGTQTFSTSSPAFTGSWTLNLTGSGLPAVGAMGNIIDGYFGNWTGSGDRDHPIIGQWEVIAQPTPEPGTLALAGLGGVSALLLARRKK